MGCKPRSKIIRRGKHGERNVDQLRVIIEPDLGASRFDQSRINAGAETLGARPFSSPLAANVESANSTRADVIQSIDLVCASDGLCPRG